MNASNMRTASSINTLCWTLVKGYMVFNMILMFRSTVHFRLIGCFKHGERVNLYRYDLKGNKNYFELAGGSSYGASELTRAKL